MGGPWNSPRRESTNPNKYAIIPLLKSANFNPLENIMRLRFLVHAIFIFTISTATAQQTFTNITSAAGITGQTGLGHAVAWCDFDGDGDQDLIFSNQDGTDLWLYRNNGDETFTNVTAAMGLGSQDASKILWGELTGDHQPDLVLNNGGIRLFRNDGEAGFTNITALSGLNGTPKGLLDVDLDGRLDVLTDLSDQLRWHRNLGSGTFASPQSVGAAADTWTTVCFDYDLDGDDDIYVGTYGASSNKLFRNNGDGTFTEVAAAAGVSFPSASHGLTTGDYDNDGWPDLYIGGYSSQRCRLYRNLGDGTFENVTSATGTLGHSDTRTVSFVDYDNDGWLDIFSSHHDFYTYSNTMLHNNGNGTFSETAASLGLSGEWIGDYFGLGWADFNDDGAPDLFTAGHIDKYRLFRNDQVPGNGLNVRLVGTLSNTSAVGARVEMFAGEAHLMRQVVNGSGRQDAHSLVLHFGLAGAAEVDSLIIHWPSGLVQKTGSFAGNQTIELVEDDGLSPVPFVTLSWSVSCSPNPFNPMTVITCAHPAQAAPGVLEIFDTRGHLVRRLTPESITPELVRATWNGKDDNGRALPSGTYLARLSNGTTRATAKLMLLE